MAERKIKNNIVFIIDFDFLVWLILSPVDSMIKNTFVKLYCYTETDIG